MKKSIFWSIILLIVSCTNPTKNGIVVYEKFPSSTNVVFQEISIPAVIPSAGDVIVVDSTLVILDMMSEKHFHLFNLNNLMYMGGYVGKGQGPSEEIMIMPTLSIENNYLVYRTIEAVKVANVSGPDFNVIDTIGIPNELNNVMYVVKMNDCLYGYDGLASLENEFISYNLKDEKIKHFGNYPIIDNVNNKANVGMLFSKSIASNVDGNKIAVLYDKFPLLRIFSSEGELLKELMFKNNQNAITVDMLNNLDQATLNSITVNYLKIKTTKNFIYGLYAGKTHVELNTAERRNADYGHEIHVWNWEGEPVARYKLPNSVSGFAVTKDDSFVICTSLMYDDKLFKFKLKTEI